MSRVQVPSLTLSGHHARGPVVHSAGPSTSPTVAHLTCPTPATDLASPPVTDLTGPIPCNRPHQALPPPHPASTLPSSARPATRPNDRSAATVHTGRSATHPNGRPATVQRVRPLARSNEPVRCSRCGASLRVILPARHDM